MKYQISSAADPITAMALLREKVSEIENVLDQPAVEVNILEFNLVGPVLAVRPYCKNENYWQVYFDTNRVMSESLNAAGFPAPVASQHMIVKQSPEA